MPIRIFLDDERATPAGWVRAWWPDEVITLLQTCEVAEVSLDHDLGDDQRGMFGVDALHRMEAGVPHG
ncbi:cyclic-phosphate processing receiver domain-containing protein [Leeia sp.]|uniref:cyclic-phosphate processing receiver domain-containing protein n=1 Tax=Leeia sp. TaxID=2884678 RepID=UPI0035B3EE70